MSDLQRRVRHAINQGDSKRLTQHEPVLKQVSSQEVLIECGDEEFKIDLIEEQKKKGKGKVKGKPRNVKTVVLQEERRLSDVSEN